MAKVEQLTPSKESLLAQPSPWFNPQPQDLVLTLLGAYVRPHRRRVWSGGLVALLSEFGFSSGAARVALTRLVRRELLARVRDGRLVHYELTPRSEELLKEGDQRIFSLGRERQTAENWTILWHAIPERERLQHARLTKRLRFLGFGSVQPGTWISPHDREAEVASLVVSLGLSEYVGVMLGQPVASFNFSRVARRAWDLDHLDARYEAFAQEFSSFAAEGTKLRSSDRESFLLRTRLVHMFRSFAVLDPELPDSYMPEPRNRIAAVETFHRLYDDLAEPSQRYFDRVTAAS